jgi:hypothetical protein
METRYGLNQAWNSRLRWCDSSTRKASGSQPGSWPRTPVRYSDHGSYGDGQNASAVGRTWTTTALWLSRWARSSQARYSAFWAAIRSGAVCDAFVGQSMFVTEAIHIARNWRLGVAGLVTQAWVACVGAACVGAAWAGAAWAGVGTTRRGARSTAAIPRRALMAELPSWQLSPIKRDG